MEFWYDDLNFEYIEKIQQLPFFHGVTTNPSILSCSPLSTKETLKKLLEIQTKPVMVQVTEKEHKGMIDQAKKLYAFSSRIIVKIPATEEGFFAIDALRHEKIPVLATAIFSARQYLLAGLCGAKYAAPYFSKMLQGLTSPMAILATMKEIQKNYQLPTKILAASLHQREPVIKLAEIGIDAVTLRHEDFVHFLEAPEATIHHEKAFVESFAKAGKEMTF